MHLILFAIILSSALGAPMNITNMTNTLNYNINLTPPTSNCGSFDGYTTDSNNVGGPYYIGGSETPYNSGESSCSGLVPARYSTFSLEQIFPGYWGIDNSINGYNYTVLVDGVRLLVNCFCIDESPCSCDINESDTYFNDLPFNKYLVVPEFQSTTYYINGTLDGSITEDRTWVATHKPVVISMGTVVIFVFGGGFYYMFFYMPCLPILCCLR